MLTEYFYRPFDQGRINSLLKVRSCGHYVKEHGWSDMHEVKDFIQLYWCVKGELLFHHPAGDFTLYADDVCYYFPGDYHDVAVTGEMADFFWLTIDEESSPSLIKLFDLERSAHYAGICPVENFMKICNNIQSETIESELLCSATAYDIILHSQNPKELEKINNTVAKFEYFVAENFIDPNLNIEKIADFCGVHRTTLFRIIRQSKHLSPKEYLTNCRLEYAVKLLRSTTDTIQQIADISGFNDAGYFSKVCLEKLGKLPSSIRNK
ncbi:MAG: helix-turn-helix transcriptional regulator [Lentisphaerae bacterium]|nr:helix-turn-helix transcriptional regulator [Lentisphaerota bacterium]